MITVLADNDVVFDSDERHLALAGAKVNKGINVGGTAEFIMPPQHPAFDRFVNYKTLVKIYRDNRLLFRGRSISRDDDFYKCRTVLCEGELCFLRDSIVPPYLYYWEPGMVENNATPEAIFTDLIQKHNAQVDSFKQFTVGTITVTDPNNYVRFESENPDTTLSVVNKLIERCGGYIVITAGENDTRVINWLAELTGISSQSIEFGKNLTDFQKKVDNTDFCTRLYPFGARDETTGERLTISSVNDGVLYVEDSDAVSQYGVVGKTVVYDDITTAVYLKARAERELSGFKTEIAELTLSAVDLSMIDSNIDSFDVGETVYIKSAPHGVDNYFQLTERSYDLLNPGADTVTFVKQLNDTRSLPGTFTASQVEESIKTDLKNQQAITAAKLKLLSEITQTADLIRSEVSQTYATEGDLRSAISTMEQTADALRVSIQDIEQSLGKYFRFDVNGLTIGSLHDNFKTVYTNDEIQFYDGNQKVAYIKNRKLMIETAQFLTSIIIGNFAFVPRLNGNLSLVKVGD